MSYQHESPQHKFTLVVREFKQIATATSTTAVVDAVSWEEYVS